MHAKAKGQPARAKPKRDKNGRLPTCTQAEKAAVDRFLRPLLKGAEESAVKYKSLSKTNPSALVSGTLEYWLATAKALRWAVKVNLQRRT